MRVPVVETILGLGLLAGSLLWSGSPAAAEGLKGRFTDTTLGRTTDALGNERTRAAVIAAHATGFRPAPLPDQDYEAPHAQVASGDASLTPDFFASRNHFQGDGFSHGSSLDGDRNNRIRPAGGMSLQIPMQ